MTVSKKKAAISPVSAVGFENFLYGQMQNYPDKLKVIGWSSLNISCKNEWATFTRCLSFASPLLKNVLKIKRNIKQQDAAT